MSNLPCLYCDGPVPTSEAERASLCPLCSRPLTVAGRYRLKALLSKSESDRVYSAVGDNGQVVAVKVYLVRDDDWTAISEFERMARTLQSSKSRNVPQIFGWDKGGGRLILVREQCAGHTLADRLRAGQQLSPGSIRKMLEDLLQLLSELHRLSPPLLHRDIRAVNLLFREAGNWMPVLVDFDPRAGGSIAEDLQALGSVFPGNPVADKLAAGGFTSADQALSALRQTTTTDAPLRKSDVVRPPTKRLVWPWLLLAVLAGVAQYIRHRPTRKSPKNVTVATSSDKGDSTVEKYRRQCDDGEAMGCYNLAYRYEKGKGIGKSESRSATIYQQSCDMGEKMACNNLGVLFESGRGVARDYSQAARLYTRACDQKDWLACRNLGYLYSNGMGVGQDAGRAIQLYTDACKHEEIKGCYNLGVLYENGKGVPADNDRALKLYQQACDGKDWEGCTNVGWMYAQGKGVAVDNERARNMYQKACDHEDARGCNNLGVIYEKGRNVPINFDRAFSLYTKACDGDDYFGCCNLGYFYESGKGTAKDLNRATSLYAKSCKLGYDKGCQYFGDQAKDRRTRDYALQMLSEGCDDGDGWSCDQFNKFK